MRSSSRLLVGFVIAALVPVAAHAQTHAIDRGSYLVSGTADFVTVGGEIDGESVDREVRITLAPSVQYFFRPGLAVGGAVTLSRNGSGDSSVTQYGIGPRVTYYFGAESGTTRTWFPYLGGGVRWLKTRFSDGFGPDEDPSASGFDARAGILFMLSTAVGLNSELFYESSDAKNTGAGEVNSNTFGLAIGISAFLF